MSKKELFQKELLIDYALDLNNIYRDKEHISVEEQKLIDKIELNVNNIFSNKGETK